MQPKPSVREHVLRKFRGRCERLDQGVPGAGVEEKDRAGAARAGGGQDHGPHCRTNAKNMRLAVGREELELQSGPGQAGHAGIRAVISKEARQS